MSPLTLLRMAPWLAILILLAYAGRLNDLRERHLHRAETFQAQLKAISDKKDEQKAETGRNIASAKERIVYVDRVAREIEEAPLPGQCATPPQILSADL